MASVLRRLLPVIVLSLAAALAPAGQAKGRVTITVVSHVRVSIPHDIAPKGAQAHHFAFDVTPHELVTAIVTERGIVRPANGRNLKKLLS